MALQPVTGVTPLNRSINVSFSGEKNKLHRNTNNSITSSAKAVPLAVLIAMSPLNKSTATDSSLGMQPATPPRTELLENVGFLRPVQPLVKVIDSNPSDVFPTHDYYNNVHHIFKLNKLSLDGNDNNFEALECIRYTSDGKYVNDRFIIKQVDIWDVTEKNDIKMLKLGSINLNKTNLNDYNPVDLDNHSYNYPLISTESNEILAHLKPIINSHKNNGAIKMKHYKGPGYDVDFCEDYVRLLKERRAVLNVLNTSSISSSTFSEKKPSPVGDDIEIKNIRTGQRIFRFRKLNLDDDPTTFEALEMRRYSGDQVIERALLTEAAFTKNSAGQNIRFLSGIKLPVDNLDSYKMGMAYKCTFTPKDEDLGQVLENILRSIAGAYKNYGAFRVVSVSEAMRSSRNPFVKQKMNNFLSQ